MVAVAFFVSPHGFGHAARAAAVLGALADRRPGLEIHLFTTVPRWFFAESLAVPFRYHRVVCDVGLVQTSPLDADPAATVVRLEGSPWNDPAAVARLARHLEALGCALVIADISALGLRAAARAGLPAVLVESFTWGWIYDRLPGAPRALQRLGRAMAEDVSRAELRVQARPCCEEVAGATAVPPIARRPRLPRETVRRLLGIPPDGEPVVLASMGGVPWTYGPLERLAAAGAWTVVPGGAVRAGRRGRLLKLPFHGRFYHPDLVAAADAVVGKLGYSTVAEALRTGAAFAYLSRPEFPESSVLAGFVEARLNARELDRETFATGRWLPVVAELLAMAPRERSVDDGAAAAAAAILERFPEVFG